MSVSAVPRVDAGKLSTKIKCARLWRELDLYFKMLQNWGVRSIFERWGRQNVYHDCSESSLLRKQWKNIWKYAMFAWALVFAWSSLHYWHWAKRGRFVATLQLCGFAKCIGTVAPSKVWVMLRQQSRVCNWRLFIHSLLLVHSFLNSFTHSWINKYQIFHSCIHSFIPSWVIVS